MVRTVSFSQVLWLLTSAWLAGCGRLGFDDGDSGASNHLPDAALTIDAPAVAIDAPAVGPKITVGQVPEMTTACGMAAPSYQIAVDNPGDQDLTIRDAQFSMGAAAPAGGGGPGTSYALLTVLPLTIPAGGTAKLEVRVPTAVVGTDRGGTTKPATLTLTTNAPGRESVAIDMTTTVMGANLDVTIVGGGGADGLTMNLTGTGAGSCPPDRSIKITNSGNLAVQAAVNPLNGGSGLGVSFASGFTSGMIDPSQAGTATFKPFTTSACTLNGGQLTISSPSSGVCTSNVIVTVNFSMSPSSASGTCGCS